MREFWQTISEVVLQQRIVVIRNVTTKVQGIVAAEKIADELVARRYEGDPDDLAGHELAHQWAAAECNVAVDMGVTINWFSGSAVGAFVNPHTKDLEIIAKIVTAPHSRVGERLTTIGMSDGDIKIYHRYMDGKIRELEKIARRNGVPAHPVALPRR